METKLSLENISVIYNEDVEESFKIANYAKDILQSKSLTSKVVPSSKLSTDTSFVITIGGDGTLLKAAGFYARYNIPVFGINLGRLGFLAQANPDELEYAIQKLVNGEYKIQDRLMLTDEFERYHAMNDFVIKGDTFSRTSKLFLSINGNVVCDYLADGIIVSTPTGSTAYTLSAGGPVIAPELNALVIVPICPHTLTARPLVIPDDEEITISSCKSCKCLNVSADGQATFEVNTDDVIKIKKSKHKAKLVILDRKNSDFYSILRQKLQWGVAPEK